MVLASQHYISRKIQTNYVKFSSIRLASSVASVMEDGLDVQGTTKSIESKMRTKR